MILIHDGRAVLAGKKQLRAVDGETGKTLWTRAGGGTRLFIANERIWSFQREHVVGWDLKTGERIGSYPEVRPGRLLVNQLTDRPQGTEGALDAKGLSEAYYLLGMIESCSMTHFWIDESSNHLEAAVRVEPQSPHARLAFGLFEENMISGYGAISEYDLPTDVWVRLETLRKLVNPTRPGL